MQNEVDMKYNWL